ncbi:MAG: MFS transporter [Methanolinea sp.]|nr:MFS transporter [Methanolinea sp.]
MRDRLPVLSGVFGVMALSNAIVPVLPLLAEGTTMQGAIYSAYFLGALLFVLPAGFLADRIGERPLIRAGLLLTLGSGLALFFADSPVLILSARLVEGFAAGLFVPASLALLNSGPDHDRMSGYFMALLNLGLVTGLVAAGFLARTSGSEYAGVIAFTGFCLLPFALSMFMRGQVPSRAFPLEPRRESFSRISLLLSRYFWLWFSAVVLIGITGALTAHYPEYTDLPPDLISVQIAAMSVATAAAILVTSHIRIDPVALIRIASIAMAAGVLLVIVSPWGFLIIGWLAGMVMVAQLSFLAVAETRQGLVMGLFSTASYGGMAILPFIAGVLAEGFGFLFAFAALAASAILVAATIGRCECRADA